MESIGSIGSGRVGQAHLVRVALLGEKQLAVMGELLLARVAGDQREEVRRAPVPLRPQDPPEPLPSSWREPNAPETWMSTSASGRSTAKFPTFDSTMRFSAP